MAKKPQEMIISVPGAAETERQNLVMNLAQQHDKAQREALMKGNTVLISAQLTDICLTHNKSPEEVVSTYARVYDLVQDWYDGRPMKDQVKIMLDSLLPTETLEARGYVQKTG